MSLTCETPAPLPETLDLYTRNGIIKPIALKTAIVQLWKSDTFGFRDRDSGELVAVIGLCPVPAGADTELELWFACRPSVRPHLVALAHISRLTLARAAQTTGLAIRAHVRRGHQPGQRLARLAGLQRVGEAGPFEVWGWAAGEKGART